MTGSSQPPILKARGITKSFGGFRAVNDISLDLAASEILGVIGPNGAGKSTLFNLLAGALPVDAGSIHLARSRISPKHGRKPGSCPASAAPSRFPARSPA
jgi:ABC-type branched-subunit amino acid transport system ATPase component